MSMHAGAAACRVHTMRLLILALLSCLLVVSCTRELAPPIASRRELALTLHGDTRFTFEERLLAESAAIEVGRFTRGRARFLIAWDSSEENLLELVGSPRLVRSPGMGSAIDLADGFARGRVKAWVDPGPPLVIYVAPERCAELYPVLLHELGHAAGLGDLEGVAAVMRRDGPAWMFTRHDHAECVRVGVCGEE